MPQPPAPQSDRDEFAAQAGERRPGILREFWEFLKWNRKWWLVPLLLVLLALGALILLSSSPVAPLIYTVF